MEPKQYLTVFLVFFSAITCMSIEAVELIRNKGSGTLSNIAQVWAENYQQHVPGVEIIVIGSTPGAGIAEFSNASIEIINSSQPLSDKEIELPTRRGKNPSEHLVAYDALALFVYNNNPIPSLSISDLAQIFAEGGRTKYWTDFDVEVPNCNEQRIVKDSKRQR